MAVPFLGVNLRSPACDFEPLTLASKQPTPASKQSRLAPKQPTLDLPAAQASFPVLRKWLGELVSEPCSTPTGVTYFLPFDESITRGGARVQCLVPRDLQSGPILQQYIYLRTLLTSVQPAPGEAALLSAVRESFESLDRAGVDRLGDCLFKYRDGQNRWHLVWAWGYRRKAERPGRADLCPRCSLLALRGTRETFRCSACGLRPLARLLIAAALAMLWIGAGLGIWAAAGRSTSQPDVAAQQIAPAPAPQAQLVERPHKRVSSVSTPSSMPPHDGKTIAKVFKPIQPKFESPRQKPALIAALVKPIAPPQPVPVKIAPVNVAAVTVAPAPTPSVAIAAGRRRPAAILAPTASGHMPHGVRVGPDGKVYLGYRPVAPTFEATSQFAPAGNRPSRYIFGSHVYAESQDELHGGQPALEQLQHYVMSDERSDRSDGAGHAVSLVLVDRGTDAEISNACSPGRDAWADNGSAVQLVQSVASTRGGISGFTNNALGVPTEPSMIAPTPRFDLSPAGVTPFYGTVPRCHPHNQVVMQQTTDPALFRRFTPTQRDVALDARLTVVALQYVGHSSPEEVLADLQAARTSAQSQATTPNTCDAHHAILQLCDSEIALWQDVISSGSTADSAEAAYHAGDVQHAGVLCHDYQSQVAAYAGRPEWSLFATQSERVTALVGRLGRPPVAVR